MTLVVYDQTFIENITIQPKGNIIYEGFCCFNTLSYIFILIIPTNSTHSAGTETPQKLNT